MWSRPAQRYLLLITRLTSCPTTYNHAVSDRRRWSILTCLSSYSLRPATIFRSVDVYKLTFSPNNLAPELKVYVGQGCLLALDEGMTVLPQMNCGGLCKVYIGLKCPENWTDENPLPDEGKREWLANWLA